MSVKPEKFEVQRHIILGLNVMLCAGSLLQLYAGTDPGGFSKQAALVLVFAWLGVFSLTHHLQHGQSTGPMGAAALLISLTCLLSGGLLYVSVAAYAACLSYRYPECPAARNAAFLLLAIVANQALAPLVYSLMGNELNTLDAFLVEELFSPGIARDGTTLFRDNGHAIKILPECSSFYNISQGLLFWATTAAIRNRPLGRTDFLVGLSTAALLFGINFTRLYFLSLNHDAYIYWHNEYGRRIYAYIFAAGMVSLPLMRLWFSNEDKENHLGPNLLRA